MQITSAKPGNFCWFELATSDQTAAKQFYTSLFGWTANDSPMGPDAVYTMFQLNGRNVGAAYSLMPDQTKNGVPSHWGTYVATANADDTVAKAKSLGAITLMEPMDVFDYGRMAILQDPMGAIVNVWQSKQHFGAGVMGEIGAFCWSELLTHDTAAATKFYTALFGWKTKVTDGAGFPYTHWQNDGFDIGGMMAIVKEWGSVPSHWVNYVQVQNCDDIIAKSKSLGGSICVPAMDIPNTGRFAILQDPQGAKIAVIALDLKNF